MRKENLINIVQLWYVIISKEKKAMFLSSSWSTLFDYIACVCVCVDCDDFDSFLFNQ
jgi:hypothetical protein